MAALSTTCSADANKDGLVVDVRDLCLAPADEGTGEPVGVAAAANEVGLAFEDRGGSTTSLKQQRNDYISLEKKIQCKKNQ